MNRHTSCVVFWLLIFQVFAQSLAPYPMGLLIRPARAQDITSVATPAPSPSALPLSPAPSTTPSAATTSTPSATPSQQPTPTVTLPTSIPSPTPTPSAKKDAPSPTPSTTPGSLSTVLNENTSSKKQSVSATRLSELQSDANVHVISLNTKSVKQTYQHKEKKADPHEEVSLRSVYGKAFKIAEKDALKDVDFDSNRYKELQKKNTEDSDDTFVPPKSDRIYDALLGTSPPPTPTPKEPLPALGKLPSQKKNTQQKTTKNKTEEKKTSITPTPFFAPNDEKDPNAIQVEPVIEPKESNANSSTAQQGIYRFEISGGDPLHFQDADGTFKDIDSTAVIDETDKYEFRNAAGPYVFRAASTLGGGVEYTDQNGKLCRFGLGAVEGAALNKEATGSVKENKIVYANIYPDADLEFTLANGGVKTEVVAKTKAARKMSYTFDLYDCAVAFRDPVVVQDSLGSAVSAKQNVVDDTITEVEVDENGLITSEVAKNIKKLTIRPNYNAIEDVENTAINARTSVLDKIGGLIPGLGSSSKKQLTDVGLNEKLRIDPTLSTAILAGYTDQSGLAHRYDTVHAVGTIDGFSDARAFFFFDRGSIPNSSFDVIGGYLSLYQLTSNGDVYAEAYNTQFGSSNASTNSINGLLDYLAYPGVGSSLPDMITIDAGASLTTAPADKTGVFQYMGNSIEGNRRIHVPWWVFNRWKAAPCAAEGCWTSNEGLMVKAANTKGFKFASTYNPTMSQQPRINVFMSSDASHPDQGRPPTIPDIYMPRSGSYIEPIDGPCDESASPATGDCRTTTYVPLVTGAGDPDGWGPGDILGVQYSMWSTGGNSYAPFVYGTSPGITANIDATDNIYYWHAYSKDRTNRTSATTAQQVLITDTTPPSVPKLNALAAFTPGTGTESSRQVDIVSPGSYDDMHVKAAEAFGTYYTIDYRLEYSTSSSFTNAMTTSWQSNNPLFSISAYGADQQQGTSDDLLENTTYYFRMKARDTFGNVSAWSDAVSTTFDTVQPTISSETLSSQRASQTTPAQWDFSYADANASTATFSLVNSAETSITPTPSIAKQSTESVVPVPGTSQAYKAAIVSVNKKTKVYVAMKAVNKVAVIDGETATTLKTIDTTSPMSGIIYGAGFIWAVDETSNYLYKIDPASDTIVKKTALSVGVRNNWRLTYVYGALWLSTFASSGQEIYKLTPDTGALQCTVRPPGTAPQAYVSPEMLVTKEGKLWATYYSYGYALEINSDCSVAKQSDHLGFALWGLFEENDHIWVAAYGDSAMVKMDKNGHKLATYSLPGAEPLDGTYDGQYIYLLQYGNSKYVKYDPATMTAVEENSLSPLTTLEVYSDGRYHWLPSNTSPGTIYRYDTARWNEDQKPPEITSQTIATPTVVDARAQGSLAQSAAFRLTSATVGGETYIYAIQQWQGAISKVRSRDAHYETTIQLDKTKFANLASIAASGTHLYVASHEGWIGVIDMTTDTLTSSAQVAQPSEMLEGIVYYDNALWLGYYGSAKIVKIDASSYVQQCSTDLSSYGTATPISTRLDLVNGNLWTNHYTAGRLIRIGSDCHVAASTPSHPNQAVDMFSDGKYLWSVSYSGSRLYAHDIQTGAFVKDAGVAAGPVGAIFDGKYYWVATAGSPEKIIKYDALFNELSRYSATNGNVSSQDVVKDNKYLWYANYDTGSLTRFDTTPTEPYGSVVPADEVIYTKNYTLTGPSGSQSISFDTQLAGELIDDGTYTAKLTVTDRAGQTKDVEKVMVVDNSAPSIALTNSLTSGWVTNNSVLLQGQLAATHTAGHEDFDVNSFQYRFGTSGAWTDIAFDGQNIFNTTVAAPDGASTLYLRASDTAGNTTQQSYDIQTDTADPVLSAIAPSTLYAGTKPTLSYHVEETTAGSGIAYGTNPQGMKVQIQYTHNGSPVVKTLVDNGVIGDASLATTLTCSPASGATTSTDNGVTVASAVDCSMPILSDLPEALYNLVIWAKDYAGHEVTDYSTFQIKDSIYHVIQSPEADAHIASGAATLTGTTSRGAQLTIANEQLAESRTFTLDPTLAGTGSDSFVLDNFVVTCGEMRDTDNNPATPDEEVCDWSTRVASAVAQTDTDTDNTLTITAADGYGNNSVKTIDYVANVFGINLTLQPANRYFSPNGDGQLDGVVFTTTIDDGVTVNDWEITISDSGNAVVRTLSGIGSLPSSITWDGTSSGGSAVADGEYTWAATVHANDVAFQFPSAQNATTATLTAKSTITDQVLIMSPSTGYVTSAGVVAVAGLAPATVTATDLSQNKLKGNILVRLCVDTVGTTSDCDYTANANVDEAGNFSTLVVLPKDSADQTATHTITAYAYDEYGNSTDLSTPVTVTTDTRGGILSASSTALTPASTSDAYAAYEAGTADIDTIANAWVRVSVSQYTQYVKLSYATHTIRDGLYQATGELTTIGYINNEVESSSSKNPDADSRVKHIQATNPITTNYSQAIANTCQTAAGCEWYVRLPVAPSQAGVYDIVVQAVKGEVVSEASVGYKVDGSSPNAPTIAMTDQVVDGSATVAYLHDDAVQVRSPRIRLYGATTPGSKLRVRIGTGSKQVVDMYVNGSQVSEVTVGSQGVYEVDADITAFLANGTVWDLLSCSARDTDSNCELGTFVLTPQSYELDGDGNVYHTVDGQSMQYAYDAQPPTASEITATTTGVNIVSPWGTTGTPIHYDVTTADSVRYAQIKRPDSFTRIFDTAPGNSFSAVFPMSKNEASGSATMLNHEGYFNPVITLVDYAGNITSYDAADYDQYGLGDFRGRIDDSIPLTSRMPFSTWNEGGKAAHDAPLTQDSVYINTLSQGFVTRSKTIRVKALAERGQRVQFKVNGENHGDLIDVADQNCAVPDADTPSSETPDTERDPAMTEDLVWNAQTGEYMLPTADRTSANGLTVRDADQCEVAITYTFPGDGTSHQEDGTPTESIDVQLTSIDHAGSQSNITAPIKVYYDTYAPKEPEAILYQDDIGVRGERMGYYDITMTSPNGTVTTTGEGVLDGDGDSMEIVHKVFTDEWGIFTIVVHTYDAAGNVSTTTRTIERKPEDPDPADGIGGSGNGVPQVQGQMSMHILLRAGGQYAVSNVNVPTPQVAGMYDSNKLATINGQAVANGETAVFLVQIDSSYYNERVRNYICRGFKWYASFYNTCVNYFDSQYALGNMRSLYVKFGKVKNSSTVLSYSSHQSNTAQSSPFSIQKQLQTVPEQVRGITSAGAEGILEKSVAGSQININTGLYQSSFSDWTNIDSSDLTQLGSNAPRGLPIDGLNDADFGQGPGGVFSHVDGQGSDISAIDIINKPEGTEVKATMDGIATLRRNMPVGTTGCSNTYPSNKVWGCYVTVVNQETGYVVINAHMDYDSVIAKFPNGFDSSVQVSKGAVLGKLGNTGYSSAPHLHYEIRKGSPGSTNPFVGYLGSGKAEQRNLMSQLLGITVSQLSR